MEIFHNDTKKIKNFAHFQSFWHFAQVSKIWQFPSFPFNQSMKSILFNSTTPSFPHSETILCFTWNPFLWIHGLVLYWIKSNVTANHMRFAESQENRIFVLKEDPVNLRTWIEILVWNEFTFPFPFQNNENYFNSMVTKTFISKKWIAFWK